MIHLTFLFAIILTIKAYGFDLNDEIGLKTFDEKAYQEWTTYSILDKLPYILDKSSKETFSREYDQLRQFRVKVNEGDVDTMQAVVVSYESLYQRFQDFLEPKDVNDYMDMCDTNKNQEIELLEYVVCRGWFGTYLNPHGQGEYDVLESIIVHDYEEKRNDPNFLIPGYRYDENGIIID